MPKRYPQSVIEGIWAMLCDGQGPSVIRRALAAGEITGKPVEMPERTLTSHIRKLRIERGDPAHSVAPGRELETARAIRRAALEMLGQQLERLRSEARVQMPKPLPAKELEALRKLAQTADEIAQREAKAPPSSQAEYGADGARIRDGNPGSLLAAIGRENADSSP